jgi:hypothetical protein
VRRVLAAVLLGACAAAALATATPAAADERPDRHLFLALRDVVDEWHRTATCRPRPETPVPAMVADVFRCRLAPHLAPEEVERVAREAVVVAECESRFDPDVVVFDGRYTDSPHPRTGMRYTAAGVFQFIRATADDYIVGGYANVSDPVANTDAAARLYLDTRAHGGGGWEPWECAAVNGAFKASSVLPGWPGGPAELPAWAMAY